MENKIEMVEMKREHLSEVLEIERATFSEPWRESDFLEGIEDSEKHYFCAIRGTKVVGYIGYWGVLDEAQIYNVAVLEEERRKGIGERMLEHLLKEGRKDGREVFLLEVRVSNEKAIKLYQKFGFLIDGKRPNFYENPKEDAFLMSLRA